MEKVDADGSGTVELDEFEHMVCASLSHTHRPGGNPGANLKSISHRCYLPEVAFVWDLTKEIID